MAVSNRRLPIRSQRHAALGRSSPLADEDGNTRAPPAGLNATELHCSAADVAIEQCKSVAARRCLAVLVTRSCLKTDVRENDVRNTTNEGTGVSPIGLRYDLSQRGMLRAEFLWAKVGIWFSSSVQVEKFENFRWCVRVSSSPVHSTCSVSLGHLLDSNWTRIIDTSSQPYLPVVAVPFLALFECVLHDFISRSF